MPLSARRASRAAFTMLELLMALAIIALLAGILVSGSSQVLSSQAVTTDDVFWRAVQAGRQTALKSGNEVHLTFVDDKDKGKEFVIDDGTMKQEFPVTGAAADTLEVSFLAAQTGGTTILVGGVAIETQTMPSVTLYADGTCTPFRLQIAHRSGAHTVGIDPWTCAPVLIPPDPNAPPVS